LPELFGQLYYLCLLTLYVRSKRNLVPLKAISTKYH